MRLQPRDTPPVPVVLTAVTVCSQSGHTVTGLRWLLHDVMERKAFEAERARQTAERTLREAEEHATARERHFLREILASVTEGRLCLCESEENLPPPLPRVKNPKSIVLSLASLSEFRQHIREAEEAGLPRTRAQDILTAAGEAATNAIKHTGDGTAQVRMDTEAGRIQVWIQDHGSGIAADQFPRATLEKGYTTAGTLGHGFHLMLLTGPSGTTLVLEQGRTPAEPDWMAALRS